MKKKLIALLIIAVLSLYAFVVNTIDDYFFDNQDIKSIPTTEAIVLDNHSLPDYFVQAGELISESEWGGINVDEIQGITHSETHWYISNQWELYKISRDSIGKFDAHIHLLSLNKKLETGWYRHFGGIVYNNGYIYIATTGRVHAFTTNRAVSIIIVLDANLEFVKYGILPPNAQKNAGWVGFNPITQHLYSSNGARELLEYDSSFENGDTLQLIQRYKMNYNNLNLSEEQWEKIASQGGAFTPSGLFYYVLDKKDAQNESYTGIHGFRKMNDGYYEFELPGVNNKGENSNFINIKYVGKSGNDRLWELEDITITREGNHEFLYHLQLHNGKKDHARIVRYRLNYMKKQNI